MWFPSTILCSHKVKITLPCLGILFAHFSSYPLKLVGSPSLKLWQIVYLSWVPKSKWYLLVDSRTLGNTLLSPFHRRRNRDSKTLRLLSMEREEQRWDLRPGLVDADPTTSSLRMLVPQIEDRQTSSAPGALCCLVGSGQGCVWDSSSLIVSIYALRS